MLGGIKIDDNRLRLIGEVVAALQRVGRCLEGVHVISMTSRRQI